MKSKQTPTCRNSRFLFNNCFSCYAAFPKSEIGALQIQNQCIKFINCLCQAGKPEVSTEIATDIPLHPLEKLEYSYTCFYCQHCFDKPRTSKSSTNFRCGECKVPLCRLSKGNCWQLHELNGVPKKRHLSKTKNQ